MVKGGYHDGHDGPSPQQDPRMASRLDMLRCATSHDVGAEKLISVEKRVPLPKDEALKAKGFDNSLLNLLVVICYGTRVDVILVGKLQSSN